MLFDALSWCCWNHFCSVKLGSIDGPYCEKLSIFSLLTLVHGICLFAERDAKYEHPLNTGRRLAYRLL